MGRGGGSGAGGQCVCPKCGAAVPHRQGVPCLDERCSACGVALVREGSQHHQQLLIRQQAGGTDDE